MPEEVTEKKIRARLSDGQTRFGENSIRRLLTTIDEQRGTIAMHEANADEAALKAARREARIEELIWQNLSCERESKEQVCAAILADENAGGNAPARIQIELRNLRAQVAEARVAGHPVNLFEELAYKAQGLL